MITKLGEYRGYQFFYQEIDDFEGVYTEPSVSFYLGQTFEEAKRTLDAALDMPEEEDVPFDEDLAAELGKPRKVRKRR